jgi:hypothetical protein
MKFHIVAFLFLCLVLAASSVFTMGKLPEKTKIEIAADSDNTIYVWNDGNNVRVVKLDTQRIVQFKPHDTVNVRTMDTGAIKISTYGTVQVWKLSKADGQASNQLVELGGTYSPVFIDDNGSIRALPGGYVIALDRQISDAEAGARLAELGINFYQKLNFGENLFKIPTEPGLTALEQANALNGKPGVRFAAPDWWRPFVPK